MAPNTSNKQERKDLLRTVLDLVDAVVELYLRSVIRPFLKWHEVFYAALNKVLRQALDRHRVPQHFTANFITYARTVLVFPTIVLLAWGHQVGPAILVILVDMGDFLDGVVARYWVDQANKEKEESSNHKSDDADNTTNKSRSSSPSSDKDSFGTLYDVILSK